MRRSGAKSNPEVDINVAGDGTIAGRLTVDDRDCGYEANRVFVFDVDDNAAAEHAFDWKEERWHDFAPLADPWCTTQRAN